MKRISAILATGEFTVQQNTKNKDFDRQCNLRHNDKKEILRSLTADDCIAIEPNNNPSYPDAEVYIFLKNCNINVYGEDKKIKLYIKMYLVEGRNNDTVIVISFHEEGRFQ